MLPLLFAVIALSWDSFCVGICHGFFDLGRVSRRRLAILFALCDGGAVGIGYLLPGNSLPKIASISDALWAVALLLLVFLLILHIVGGSLKSTKWPLNLIPFLLAIDNLVAGPALIKSSNASLVLCMAFAGAGSASLFIIGALSGRGVADAARAIRDTFARKTSATLTAKTPRQSPR